MGNVPSEKLFKLLGQTTVGEELPRYRRGLASNVVHRVRCAAKLPISWCNRAFLEQYV
jgi:hypothetical protein